jgi:hypothetical protein
MINWCPLDAVGMTKAPESLSRPFPVPITFRGETMNPAHWVGETITDGF